jgi:hypothetical protein
MEQTEKSAVAAKEGTARRGGEVSLKKFKTTEALVKAYNALEAEFTKRSQRLRELERRIKEGNYGAANRSPHPYTPPTEGNCKENIDTENVENQEENAENIDTENTEIREENAENIDTENTEIQEENSENIDEKNAEKQEKNGGIEARNIEDENGENVEIENAENKEEIDGDFEDFVEKFVGKYPLAAELAAEIAAEIVGNGDSTENCLENAYVRVLEKRYLNPENALRDEGFLEKYVFGNPIVKEKIIADYIDNLQKESLPKLMARGGTIPVSPPHKPKNLAEAANMAREMLRR